MNQKASRRKNIQLKGISTRAWEHPTDRAALIGIKKIPGMALILRKLIGNTTERSLRLITLASSVQLTENQHPRIYKIFKEVCWILDVDKEPEIYISQNPFFNAGAIGVDNPFIVLNSGMIDILSEDELMVVIGHEMGHCLSGHALYKTLLNLLLRMSVMTLNIPLSGIPLYAVISALKEWDRKSELSSDRAGLLVVQDPAVSFSSLIKMAGGNKDSNINEFFIQAAKYNESKNMMDSVYKIINIFGKSHPFPVLRLAEIKTWIDSGDFQAIMNEDYPKKSQDEKDDFYNNFIEASKSYKDDLVSSKDSLGIFAKGIFEKIDDLKGKAGEVFDTMMDESDSVTEYNCNSCGSEIIGASRFCSNCGERVAIHLPGPK